MYEIRLPSDTITTGGHYLTVSGYDIYPKRGAILSDIKPDREDNTASGGVVYYMEYIQDGNIIKFYNDTKATLVTFRANLIIAIDAVI